MYAVLNTTEILRRGGKTTNFPPPEDNENDHIFTLPKFVLPNFLR